jgi:hypothetical protein
MKIFEIVCQFDAENYNEFNIITLHPSLGVAGMSVQEWHDYIVAELPYHYKPINPHEEDNNKHWMKYEYDNIHLYTVRQVNYLHPVDFEGILIFGILEVNPLYQVLISLEKIGDYRLIRNIMAIVAEHVLANSNGTRVYQPV